MRSKSTSEYGQMSVDETIALLETSANGLTESEARKRLETLGRNEVAEKERSRILEFLGRYWGPMPWLLEAAMALAYVLGHYLEAGIVFALLTTNAAIDFIHTRGSQKALELLKQKLAIKAKVLRDSQWTVRDARELVPGDVIAIGLGDLVGRRQSAEQRPDLCRSVSPDW